MPTPLSLSLSLSLIYTSRLARASARLCGCKWRFCVTMGALEIWVNWSIKLKAVQCSSAQYMYETELFHGFSILWIEDLEKSHLALNHLSFTHPWHNKAVQWRKASWSTQKSLYNSRQYPGHTQGPQNMFNQLHKHISLTFMVMEIMVVSSSAFLGSVHGNLL